ncbi:MAG: response regulator [Myxococcaceae bacterium]
MPRSILIVDDSPSLRAMVKLALDKSGFEVVEAQDGLEALERLKSHPTIKLIICDVNMPRMDGLTFVREMKKQPTSAFTPVVMLTTEQKKELVEQGKAAGAKAWMVKPFQPDQLLAVVHKLVGA